MSNPLSLENALFPQPNPPKEQGLLVQKFIDNLTSVSARVVRDGRYLRINDGAEKQLGIVFDYPEGKRRCVRVKEHEAELRGTITSLIPQALIHTQRSSLGDRDITMHPFLSDEESTALRLPAVPKGGIVPIVQGEYGVLLSDDPNEELATFGRDECRALAVLDLSRGVAALAHVDAEHDDWRVVMEMRQCFLESGSTPRDIGLRGSPNVNGLLRGAIEQVFSNVSFDLPGSFSLNRRSGAMSRFDPKSLTQETLKGLTRRVKEKNNARFSHIVGCLRAY